MEQSIDQLMNIINGAGVFFPIEDQMIPWNMEHNNNNYINTMYIPIHLKPSVH